MLDFSIIIPVYNAEKTLERCLNSINAQTFLNYEVILIDDGSSDNSLSICENYKRSNPKYQVVHQQNSGPSSARNAGLDIAKGKWICFVDSDDTIVSNYLQEIHNVTQSNDTDVVFVGYNKIYQNGKQEVFIPSNVCETKIKTINALSEKDMFGYTWIKCFKKDVINSIRFDVSLNLFEDEIFACQVISKCKAIGVVKKPIYNYYIGDGSTLIGHTHEDYCLKCDKVYSAWKKMLNNDSDKQDIMVRKANSFVSRCYYYGFERDVDIKSYFKFLRETMFFKEHTAVNVLDGYVKDNKFTNLYFEKMKYRMKVAISTFIHKKR